MRQLFFFAITLLTLNSRAELVNGGDDKFYAPIGQYSRERNSDELMLEPDLKKVLANIDREKTKYIYLNRCEKDICTTYVMQKSGAEYILVDKYPSLAGAGTGVGCVGNMTEAGLFKVGTELPSAHPHGHWGKDAYLPMEPIKADNITNCGGHDAQKVIHGRTSLDKKSCGVEQSGRTDGCVGVPTDKFALMSKQVSENNGAVIYNYNAYVRGGR